MGHNNCGTPCMTCHICDYGGEYANDILQNNITKHRDDGQQLQMRKLVVEHQFGETRKVFRTET